MKRARCARCLKERSPSCGVNEVHGKDGVRAGQGRFAARLAKRGLPVVSRTRYLKVPLPLRTKLPIAAPEPRSIGTALKRSL